MIIQTSNYIKESSTIAFIVVTYPSGSTCTCTNGSTTLTATDTSGSFVFNIPSASTWTVSCTDGTQIATKTVSITTLGQSVSVALSYALYIIKDGVSNYSFSSRQWGDDSDYPQTNRHFENITWTQNSGYITMRTNNTGWKIGAYFADNINLTEYNTINLQMISGSSNNGIICTLAVSSNSSDVYGSRVAKTTLSPSVGVATLNVSSLSGAKHIGLGMYRKNPQGSQYQAVINISNLWLSK